MKIIAAITFIIAALVAGWAERHIQENKIHELQVSELSPRLIQERCLTVMTLSKLKGICYGIMIAIGVFWFPITQWENCSLNYLLSEGDLYP